MKHDNCIITKEKAMIYIGCSKPTKATVSWCNEHECEVCSCGVSFLDHRQEMKKEVKNLGSYSCKLV